MPKYRKKDYVSLVADVMYKDVIQPLLARYSNTHLYVAATKKAVPLMQRIRIDTSNLMTQFYSDLSFKEKVAYIINPS
jgi:hypothetical protein